MDIGNVIKRPQADQRARNNRRPQIGLQHSETIPHQKSSIICPVNQNVYKFSDTGGETNQLYTVRRVML